VANVLSVFVSSSCYELRDPILLLRQELLVNRGPEGRNRLCTNDRANGSHRLGIWVDLAKEKGRSTIHARGLALSNTFANNLAELATI
jgi:hypothetical protein